MSCPICNGGHIPADCPCVGDARRMEDAGKLGLERLREQLLIAEDYGEQTHEVYRLEKEQTARLQSLCRKQHNLLLEVYAELKITRMGYGSEKEFMRLGDKIAATLSPG